MMSRYAVEVTNLYFSYDNRVVLEDIDLKVQEGDFLSIIGPNGGGKSTLLKIIMGILKPTKGEVKLFGMPPQSSKSIIGYVPQETGSNIEFPITVLEIVLMGVLHKRGFLKRFDSALKDKALEVLKAVGMELYVEKKFSELSGGQRQRVLIARALCSDPDILMLDEPTASIDFGGQKEIFELLEKLNSSMTIIVVSHDMSMVMGFAKHAVYINKTALMHSIDAHTRYQIKRQLEGHDGHYCGAEFWRDMGKKFECTKECEDA